MSQMLIHYPLKPSLPSNFSSPLLLSLQQTYNTSTSYTFQPLLHKINQLRNKTIQQINSSPQSDQQIDKTIQLTSAYIKFANILLKRFNWNPEQNKHILGISFVWFDSFQKVEKGRNGIGFDVFCCYYNLVILYWTRALKLAQVDLDSARKEAIVKAKAAVYILKEIKEKFIGEYGNIGFHDTQPAHFSILQNLCYGLIYKCTYDTFKTNEYKIGINKIASIANYAQRYFYKAWSAASNFFTNQASGIHDKTKTQILSLSFIESLYFDVITNMKLAKNCGQMVEKGDIGKFAMVIGYQKKAYQVLEIALGNNNVQQLLNMYIEKKKQLFSLKQQLSTSISKDIQRNTQIYHQPQLSSSQLPPAQQLPPQMNLTITIPPNLLIQNEGQFSKLMSPQSSKLTLQLSTFAKSRKTMLDTSFKKLNDEVTKVFIDTGINFYLDEEDSMILCEGKLKAAYPVDQKILAKYSKNLTYIAVLDQADEQICLVLPKVQKGNNNTKNVPHIMKMKQIVQKIKQNAQQIDSLTNSIGDFLDKTNYALIASDTIGKQKSKQQVFKQTFLPLQSKITQFNTLCKIIKQQVQSAASIAVYLNTNSPKNLLSSKIQHQSILTSFSEIFSLFNNFSQSLTFYDKMKDHLMRLGIDIHEFVENREVSGKELEDKIKGKGEPGGGNSRIVSFPSIRGMDEEFDYNMFKYQPGEELETPQEIVYTPTVVHGTGGGLEPAKLEGNGGGMLGQGQLQTGFQRQAIANTDITEVLNRFYIAAQTPENMKNFGVKKV